MAEYSHDSTDDPTMVSDLAADFVGSEHLNYTLGEFCDKHSRHMPELRARIEFCRLIGRAISTDPADTIVSGNGKTDPAEPALQKLGDYEILDVLGNGGMGVVYRAFQISLKRMVALKTIPTLSTTPTAIKRFKTEVETVAAMDHSNIVKIYETGQIDGQSYFSMQFVAGGDLQAYESPKPALFRLLDSGQRLVVATTLNAIPGQNTRSAFHSITPSRDGRYVHAVDDNGVLVTWHKSDLSVASQFQVVDRFDNFNFLRDELEGEYEYGLPLPFLRKGNAILETPNNEIIVSGRSPTVQIWKLDSVSQPVSSLLRSRVGTDPAIACDLTRNHLMWSIGSDGVLRIVDIENDQELTSVAAHEEGACSLVAIEPASKTENASVITAGVDGRVRYWKYAGGKISPVEKQIQIDRGLVSLDVCKMGDLIAGVDDESMLWIWQLSNAKLMAQFELDNRPDLPMKSGCLSIQDDGLRIAACGRGQVCVIVKRDSLKSKFRRHSDQPWVAGKGGEAIKWIPNGKLNQLAISDSRPRINFFPFDFNPEGSLANRRYVSESTCIDYEITKDNRRLVSCLRHGSIVFFDSEFMSAFINLDTRLSNLTDMTFNRRGDRVVLCNRKGQLETFLAGNGRRANEPATLFEPPIPSDRLSWDSEDIASDLAGKISTVPAAWLMDDSDQAAVLYQFRPVKASTNNELNSSDNKVYLSRTVGGVRNQQQLKVDGKIFDQRIAANSIALDLREDGQLVGCFRRRTALNSPYDGQMIQFKTTPENDIRFEVAVDNVESGFLPKMLQSLSGPDESIVHFSYDGYYSCLSQKIDGQWQPQTRLAPRGVRFDSLIQVPGMPNLLVGFGNSQRHNADRAPRQLYIVKEGELVLKETEPVQLNGNKYWFYFSPKPFGDHQIVVSAFERDQNRIRLLTYDFKTENWRMLEDAPPLPFSSRMHLAVDSSHASNQIAMVTPNIAQQSLQIDILVNGSWEQHVLTELHDLIGLNTLVDVKFDRAGKLCALVSGKIDGRSWLRVLRRDRFQRPIKKVVSLHD